MPNDKLLALNTAMTAKLIAKSENGRGEEYLELLGKLHDQGNCGCANCT